MKSLEEYMREAAERDVVFGCVIGPKHVVASAMDAKNVGDRRFRDALMLGLSELMHLTLVDEVPAPSATLDNGDPASAGTSPKGRS